MGGYPDYRPAVQGGADELVTRSGGWAHVWDETVSVGRPASLREKGRNLKGRMMLQAT